MTRTKIKDRVLPTYTQGEEIFNMVTHIVGACIGIATLVLAVIVSAVHQNIAGMLCSVVFGVSMILLYTMSSIYHGLRTTTSKKVFQVIDHCTIYFLISGTYTPILICSISKVSPTAAYVTFAVVWLLTAIATTLTAIDLKKYSVFSMICYIGMGWSIIFSIKAAIKAVGVPGFSFLLAGGIFYTVGTVFYKLGKSKKYFHSIFHIFILLGSICHSLCVIIYVL